LSVDLRKRLSERFAQLAGDGADDPLDAAGLPLAAAGREEVQITLAALGYEPVEIQRALRAVAADGPGATTDDWLRDCLRWLADAAA
jgi:Holliday junction DNA helicase RuvA